MVTMIAVKNGVMAGLPEYIIAAPAPTTVGMTGQQIYQSSYHIAAYHNDGDRRDGSPEIYYGPLQPLPKTERREGHS